MFTKTKIALCVALIFGAASAALANDSGENHQDEDRAAISSVVRINGKTAYARGAYGYAGSLIQKHQSGREQTRSR
jgi:opacity protein-like surface antigen